MSFSCQKGEFDRFFNRLDRPVEESRPDRQPDRFPSLERRKKKPAINRKSRAVIDWKKTNEKVSLVHYL